MGGKILAVVDIFEALTASDRPYKPPIPVDIALKIIQKEADNNKLDKNIVRIFMEKKVWEGILEQPPVSQSQAVSK
jgi:HD-GYP domain-containing protein (c-di-GMP phosphodiesterase class II)